MPENNTLLCAAHRGCSAWCSAEHQLQDILLYMLGSAIVDAGFVFFTAILKPAS
jgi:hypothetical protein